MKNKRGWKENKGKKEKILTGEEPAVHHLHVLLAYANISHFHLKIKIKIK